MELFFRTRDLGPVNDYPAIGWIPPLPGGADCLWRRLGKFTGAEFPQMILSQKHGIWKLYLEGINSGRTDSATGIGGRIIRMSLYLTGNTTEGNEILGLLSSFVLETLSASSSSVTLKNCFERFIKVGDPRRWKDGGLQIQKENAIRILSGLKSLATSAISDFYEIGWAAGRAEANLMRFLSSCRALIEGKVEGYALSLPYCRIGDADEVQRILASEKLVALISVDPSDRDAPVRNISIQKSIGGVQIKSNPRRGGGMKPFFLVALVVAAVCLLIKSCTGTKKQVPMPKATIEETATSGEKNIATNKTGISNSEEKHGHTN